MMLRDLNSKAIRWLLLAIVTLIILIIRTARDGFFHGKDWLLYLILIISMAYVRHYSRK
jgi:Zn-dependent protease with chaperone function